MVNESRTGGAEAVGQEFARLAREHRGELIDRISRCVIETAEGVYAQFSLEEMRPRIAAGYEAFLSSLAEDPAIYATFWKTLGEERARQGHTIKDMQDVLSAVRQVTTEFIAESYAGDPETMLTVTRLTDDIHDRARVELSEVYTTAYEKASAERKQLGESRQEQIRRAERQQSAIIRASDAIDVGAGDLTVSLPAISEIVVEVLDVERASVWTLRDVESDSELYCLDLFEAAPQEHSHGSALLASQYPAYFSALQIDRAIDAHDARTDPRTRELAEGYLEPLEITSVLGAPIRMEGRVVGVVCCEHVGPARTWQLDEVAFAAAVADQVSQALNLAGREEMYERRTRQVQTSTDVAQDISAAPALDELFRRVVTLVKERFDYYHAQVFRSDLETGDLLLAEGYGEVGRVMKAAGHKIGFGKGVVGTAASNKQPVLVPDVSQSLDWLPNPHLPETRGEMAVPIMLRDRVLGVLDVQSERAGYLSAEDQLLLLGLCGQIASAIESTRLLEEANIFRQFAEASGQGMVMATQEGEIVYVNPTLCRLFGEARPEDAYGRSFLRYYPEELRQRVRNEILPAVIQEGQWVGELAILSTESKIVPVIWNFFLVRDEKGNPLYLAGVMTDITERKRAEAEMESTLRELSTLYRRYSQEAWGEFLRAEAGKRRSGYVYDQAGISPLEVEQSPVALEPAGEPGTVLALPLQVRGEAIGALELEKDEGWSADDVALVEAVAAQLALSVESARLFEETQGTLEETSALYQAASRIAEAATVGEVLDIVGQQVQEVVAGEFGGAVYLAGPDPGKPAEWVEVRARWDESGRSTQALVSVGSRLTMEQLPLLRVSPDMHQPTLIADVLTDDRLDEASRQLALAAGSRSAAVIPLVTRERWLGFIGISSGEARALEERQVRLLSALADWAAVAIENRLLFEQTQALARRERLINEITARVRGTTDMTAILRTAVQELNKVIRSSRAYIQLGTEELAFGRPIDVDGDGQGKEGKPVDQ
jgi:PAS domain S-box-containing protein